MNETQTTKEKDVITKDLVNDLKKEFDHIVENYSSGIIDRDTAITQTQNLKEKIDSLVDIDELKNIFSSFGISVKV